jgi:hypothetical protein
MFGNEMGLYVKNCSIVEYYKHVRTRLRSWRATIENTCE